MFSLVGATLLFFFSSQFSPQYTAKADHPLKEVHCAASGGGCASSAWGIRVEHELQICGRVAPFHEQVTMNTFYQKI